MKEFIQKLIDAQIDLYSKNPNRMIADYNGEKQHVNDYNGRQLLELIQNADDEQATKVSISIDTNSNQLTISNTGRSFSEAGYESLMLANFSSKTKEVFIGNKGLGFRSIINWSEEIIVRSNGVDVKFSEAIASKNFNKTFSEQEKENIRAKRGLSELAVPWAILATPEIIQGANSDWATEIIITYKEEYLADIEEQINSIQEQTLLFLNNLERIEKHSGALSDEITRHKNGNHISIGQETWKLYDTGVIALPEHLQDDSKGDVQHFNLKIALPESISFKTYYLHTYFPTKIELDLPFIVHGTFDLDSSRNQLNKTEKNEYVLKQLIQLIVCVSKDLSKSSVSWGPLKVLSFNKKNSVLEELEFYDNLDSAKNEIPIYPCIDDKYRKLEDVFFKSDTFSELLMNTEGENWLKNIVKPIDEELLEQCIDVLPGETSDLKSKINAYSHNLLKFDTKYRVQLIQELIDWSQGDVYNVLTNDKNQLIDANIEEAFTPLTSSIEKIELPEHVKIEFINSNLFRKLRLRLVDSNEHQSRELQRILKKITNIQSYEPAELLSKISSSTNRIIKENPDQGKAYIIEMVKSLYGIYAQLGVSSAFPKTVRLQLFNKENKIMNSSDLYLSLDYPSINEMEEVFVKVYGHGSFIAGSNDYKLDEYDPYDIENFMLWLGVNKFVKYKELSSEPQFISYLNELNNVPENYRQSSVKLLAIDKSVLDVIIEKCTMEEILLWVNKDDHIKSRLLDTTHDQAKYDLVGELYGKCSHNYSVLPSYLSYQFSRYELFNEYLISDDNLSNLINKKTLNYSYFDDKNIAYRDIDTLLIKMGAKEDFHKLPIKHINDLLRGLPDTDPRGKQTQKLYKLALEHYKSNKVELDNNIPLFANTAAKKKYYPQSEIYYSDNVRLPSKILEDTPVLNFPKRSGGKQITDFFRIHNMASIKVEVVSSEPISELTKAFQERISLLNPYILAYRLEAIQKQKQKENEVKLLSELRITLCKSIECRRSNETFPLENNDYVFHDKTYLINIKDSNNIDSLISDSGFCDTFSEIVSNIFMVNEHKNDFRYILRNNIEDTEHSIINELGYEILLESKSLLGISDYFASFWSAIIKSSSIHLDCEISQDNIEAITNSLGISKELALSLCYSDIETNDLDAFLNILNQLKIDVSSFNKYAFYRISLSSRHSVEFNNVFLRCQKKFKFLLWQHYTNTSNTDKSKFLNLIGLYKHQDDWIKSNSDKFDQSVNVNYLELVFSYVRQVFSIDLESDIDADFNEPDKAYKDNFKLVDIEDDADLPESVRSYLYFSDCVDLVHEYLDAEKHDEEVIDNLDTGSIDDDLLTLPDKPSETKAAGEKPSAKRSKKAGRHSPSSDKRKKKKGLENEMLVYNALVAKYGEDNVIHSSLEDDTLGYDIASSYDNGNSWKYIEVKSFSNSLFYLSKNERKFSEEHRDDYEVYLVDNDRHITMLQDVDFSDDNKFLMDVNDYVVYFELI